MRESDIQAEVMLAVGALPGVRVFRNTVGTGWSGKFVRREGDLTILRNARMVTYGLVPGSADLVGWRALETDAGRIAQFLSLELKTDRGRPSPEQLNWARVVSEAGGLTGLVRSPAEAIQLIRGEADQ